MSATCTPQLAALEGMLSREGCHQRAALIRQAIEDIRYLEEQLERWEQAYKKEKKSADDASEAAANYHHQNVQYLSIISQLEREIERK